MPGARTNHRLARTLIYSTMQEDMLATQTIAGSNADANPSQVRWFLIAASVRTAGLLELTVVHWLILNGHASADALMRFQTFGTALIVDAIPLYFLFKRSRVAWIYQVSTAALLVVLLLAYIAMGDILSIVSSGVVSLAAVAALLVGLFPTTLRWFWRQARNPGNQLGAYETPFKGATEQSLYSLNDTTNALSTHTHEKASKATWPLSIFSGSRSDTHRRYPRSVSFFLGATALRSICLFGMTVATWVNLSDHSPITEIHAFRIFGIWLLIDAVMLYFLFKRKRFAWIYAMVIAAIMAKKLFVSPGHLRWPHTELAAMLDYGILGSLICGLLPATVSWFWKRRRDLKESAPRQDTSLPRPLDVSSSPYAAYINKPVRDRNAWSTGKSIGLICLVATSISLTWLLLHSVENGHANNGRYSADLATDPKHYWLYVILDFMRCVPIYAPTWVMWKKWRASSARS